jgi:hypothetical protein
VNFVPVVRDVQFRGLADRAIGIEQALAERVNGRAPIEDQVVTVLDLREEEPMLTARRPPLCFSCCS